MKLKFIPILILSIILALTASSCSPAQVTATLSTNDVTEQTPTDFPPTATSTTTPTSTPKPTETPDPLAGAPDKKATGKDANGNWFYTETTEKGNTLTYTYDTERNAYYRPIFGGYAMDYAKVYNDQGLPDALHMTIYIDGSIIGETSIPTLTHMENTDAATASNFSARFYTNMVNACTKRDGVNPTLVFSKPNFDAHKFHLDFINPDGPQRWGIWPDDPKTPGDAIEVRIRNDYDALKANMATNGFFETRKSKLYGPENSYMIKIWTDENNKLRVDIAPSLPVSQWTEDMWYEMAFIGQGDVFRSQDLTKPESESAVNEFIKGRKIWPYFEFGPSQ